MDETQEARFCEWEPTEWIWESSVFSTAVLFYLWHLCHGQDSQREIKIEISWVKCCGLHKSVAYVASLSPWTYWHWMFIRKKVPCWRPKAITKRISENHLADMMRCPDEVWRIWGMQLGYYHTFSRALVPWTSFPNLHSAAFCSCGRHITARWKLFSKQIV